VACFSILPVGSNCSTCLNSLDNGTRLLSLESPTPRARTYADRLSESSREVTLVAAGLTELSFRLGFRSVDGFTECEVYREFFPRGLTALDSLGPAGIGTDPSLDQVAARKEVTSLLLQLNLPLDERGRRRAANRAEWQKQANKPLACLPSHVGYGAAPVAN
jgi:hypothetical protein